ncbi:hypothetical protein N7451_012716 [Penicillium sp. IBT 35674x]|nr:hypothetical protein N7451_012716 [Penicillium sp. IBT 35674x]
MDTKENYPRWLQNAEAWVSEDDWEPDEYLEWCQRLADAKRNLKDTYMEVDNEAREMLRELCESIKPELPKGGTFDSERCGRAIARFGMAYHFYTRASFEDLKDNQLVARVKKYLLRHKTGMNPIHVARMLQAAADKVPLRKAVADVLTDYTSYLEKSMPVLKEWYDNVSYDRHINSAVCEEILRASKNGLPKVNQIPEILLRVQKSVVVNDKGGYWISDSVRQNMANILNSDERIEQYVTVRSDPGISVAWGYIAQEVACFKLVLASKEIGGVLDKISSLEKNKLSWEKTIGPSCIAIIRLGKRSAGKDAEKLAEYARAHAKRPN